MSVHQKHETQKNISLMAANCRNVARSDFAILIGNLMILAASANLTHRFKLSDLVIKFRLIEFRIQRIIVV